MPLPIAHGLTGAGLVAALHPAPATRRYRLALLAGAFLANAPDFDFALVWASGSGAWHRGFTHSLAFAAALGLVFAAALGRGRRREAVGYGLAYASHGVLDWALMKLGGGVELLWPFSGERFGLGLWGLSEIPSRLPPSQVMKSLLVELLLFGPPFALVLWLRRRGRVRASAAAPPPSTPGRGRGRRPSGSR
jgi:inner membrane protein